MVLQQFFEKIDKIEEHILERQKAVEIPTKEFLTVKEAAKFLDLKVPTIYSKVHKREIPFIKIGRRLYFSKEDLIEHLNSNRRPKGFDYNNDELIIRKGGNND